MRKLNWKNCSRLREYESHYIKFITCDYCHHDFYKDQVWQSWHPVKRKWCTTCKDNSEKKAAANNQIKKMKKQMKENNGFSLF
jgi:hypothetical protein